MIYGLVMDNDSIVLAGFTDGNWSNANKGSYDYLAVKLDALDGTEEALAWQVSGLAYGSVQPDACNVAECIRRLVREHETCFSK